MSTPGRGEGEGGKGKKPHTHKVSHEDLWCTEDLVLTEEGNKRIIDIMEYQLGTRVDEYANAVRNSGGTLEFHIRYPAAGGGELKANAMCPC